MVQIIPRSDVTAERIVELLRDNQVDAALCTTATGIGVYVPTTHFEIVISTGDWLIARATWVGELSTADYVRSLVALNAANNAGPMPKFSIDTPAEHPGGLVSVLKADEGPLEVSASLVYPLGDGVTETQLRSFLAEVINAGIRLTREFHALYPERSPKQPGETFRIGVSDGAPADKVTPQRVEQWFIAQGVDEAPFDEATKCISLSLDDMPVDVDFDDPEVLQVQASMLLPGNPDAQEDIDATAFLHLCNRANLDSLLSGISMIKQHEVLGIFSHVAVPIRAGLNDSQLAQALNGGVVGATAQMRAVLHQLN
ncbi:hypothetical protein CFAEC_06170 [Corynebacterium faecale]|uniref:hypothetical protein n=1 Tax=Corynebacterium faecale TaxID=1758466 RepID=UPI0025B60668|nr:hypothetical protein [Corynebacterium faecale]WJY92070.1 hypothetical protein CFAEC_06170 [Corynebacterium faecale]